MDPAFAIWACCKCFHCGPNAALPVQPSLPAIADWLSSRLADLLDWAAADHTIELTSERHGRFAALVAESVGAAQAVTSAISNDDPNHTSVYLRALLARWDDWFGTARTGEVSAEITPLQIPFADASSPTAEQSNSGTVSDEAWRRWLTEIPGVQTLLPSLAAQQRSMAEMNTHFEARLHTAKMDSLKEFAYGAGHELQ